MEAQKSHEHYEPTGARLNPAYIHDDVTDGMYRYNGRYNQKQIPDLHHKPISAISQETNDKRSSKEDRSLLAPACLGAAFLVLALVIGGAVVIAIMTVVVNDDVIYSDVLVVGVSSTKGEITLSNTTWNPTFENSSSDQYKLLEGQFIAEMDSTYRRSNLADVYNHTTIEQFRQGSVIVVFLVYLTGATPSARQVEVQEDVNKLQEEVKLATSSDVLSVLNSETNDDHLGELLVGQPSVTEVSLTIEVQDGNSENQPPETEPPSVTCPADITQNTDEEKSTTVVSWDEPFAEDNSGLIDRIESQPESGSEFVIGETEVTVLAYDTAGNIGVCTFTVNVIDEELPSVICPSNITETVPESEATRVVTWPPPEVADNSGEDLHVDTTPMSGHAFPIGVTSVEVTVRDLSGNSASCTFFVNIVDEERPLVTCPADIAVDTNPGQSTGSVTWSPPSATDNSGQEVTLTSDLQPGNYTIGQHVVTYTGEDTSGNTAQCTFTVTVTDREIPLVMCPADIAVDTNPGQSTGSVTWSPPSATDNSGQEVTLTSDLQPGNYTIGQHVVTYTGEDTSGNTAQCTFTVTVMDREIPLLTCPADIAVDSNPGQSTGSVTWSPPSATDNSGQEVTLTSDLQPGNYAIGQHVVTYTGEDTSGNIAQCTFNVTVMDEEIPLVTCPADIAVDTNPGQSTGSVTWSPPSATDNSGQEVTLTSDLQPGNYTIGQHVVTYTGEDTSGNTAQCTFTVTVMDNEPPVINCPSDIYNKTQMGELSGYITWAISPSTDNSGGNVTVTTDYQPGEFAIGNYTVNVSATDESGNIAWCTFKFVVEPLCEPEFCLNEGNCSFSPMDGAYVCRCPEGILGKNCEFEVPGPDDCGTNPLFPSTRIVGGEVAYPGSWPWQAYLDFRAYICGAVLITDQWVLTAAHCVGDPGTRANLNAVILGEINLSNNSATRLSRSVERIVVHPGYQTIVIDNDIALIQLAEPVEFDDFVRPACLPSESNISEEDNYSNCYITGWGTDDSGDVSMRLLQAQVPLVNRTVCDQQLKAIGTQSITENMICAGFDEGMVSTCQGDSGGPLVCQEMDGRWTLVGITSWGYQCGAPENPAVFARVSKYFNYIESVIHGNPVTPCEPVNSGCLMNVPYTVTFTTTQSQIEYFVGSLYRDNFIDHSVCDMDGLNATICGFFFKGCDQAIVPCRQYCESIHLKCLQTDYICTFLPYGPPGEQWCLEGEDYCGEKNIWLSEYSRKVLKNPFLGNSNLANRDCIWFVTGPVGYDIVVRVQFLSIDSLTHTLSVGSGRDPDRRSSTIVKLYHQTQLVVVEGHEGWIRLETSNGHTYSGFSALLMVTDRENGTFPCSEDSLICSSLCLPQNWLCDGIRDCQSGEDEDNCTLLEYSVDVFLSEDEPNYIILSPGYPHYPPNLNVTWMITCPEGFVIRITLLMVDTQPCCDIIVVSDGTGQSLLQWSGYDHNEKPSVTSRGNTLRVSFQTNNFSEFSGFAADVELLNDTSDDVFDCDERYDCGQGVCIPFSGVCNDVINCLGGFDEICSESIFVNSSYFFNSPNYPSEYPSSFLYTWYFSTYPDSQLLITFSAIATEPGYDYIYVREGSNISNNSDLLLRWSGVGPPDELRILSSENIIWVTFESDESVEYNGFVAVVEVTNITRQELNCGTEFDCENGVCLPQSRVCDGGRQCGNNVDEKYGNCTDTCHPSEFRCYDGGCIPGNWICDGLPDCPGGEDELMCNDTCDPSEFSCYDGHCIPGNETCNGFQDCLWGEDEFGCNDTCDPSEFSCYDGSCIPGNWTCNGFQDCMWGEDEFGCNDTCDPSEFSCYDGSCIPGNETCNGFQDCVWGEDEFGCDDTCDPSEFSCYDGSCIPGNWTCDGFQDCLSGEDEFGCDDTCDPSEFSCYDGSCIPGNWTCDGFQDCLSGEDEFGCDDCSFLCGNLTCISPSLLCDGVNDCDDGEDEGVDTCGGDVFLNGDSQVHLLSPNYPYDYPLNLNVSWNISTLQGYKFQLQLISFHTEYSYDFITVDEFDDITFTQLIKKWSGDDSSLQVFTSTHQMRFSFYSDDIVSHKGFQAIVTSVPGNMISRCPVWYFDCGNGACFSMEAGCDMEVNCGNDADAEDCPDITTSTTEHMTSIFGPSPHETTTSQTTTTPVPTTYPADITTSTTEHMTSIFGPSPHETTTSQTTTTPVPTTYTTNITTSTTEHMTSIFGPSPHETTTSQTTTTPVPTTYTTRNPTRCNVTQFSCGDMCIENELVCDGMSHCFNSEDEASFCDEVFYIPENTALNITSPDYPSPYPESSSQTWYLRTDPGVHILVYFLFFSTEDSYDFVTIGDGLQVSSHILLKWSGLDPAVSVLSASSDLWFNFQSDELVDYDGFVAVAYALHVPANDSLECEDYQFSCAGSVCLPSTAVCDGVMSCGSGEDEEICIDIPTTDEDKTTIFGPSPHETTTTSQTATSPGTSTYPSGNTTRCDLTEFSCGDICIKNELICDGIRDCPESEDEMVCDRVFYIPENTALNITSPNYPSPYPNNSSQTWYLRTDPGVHILVYLLFFSTEESYDFVTIGDGLQVSSHLLLKWSGSNPAVSVLSASSHLWFNFQSDGYINEAGFEAVAYAVYVPANDSLECEDYQFSCAGSVCLPSTAVCDDVISCGSREDENNCTEPACPEDFFQCSDGVCFSSLLLCDGIPHCAFGEDEAASLCANETDSSQCASVPSHCQQYLPYNTTLFPHQFAANITAAEDTFWKLMPFLSCHENATAFVCAALYPDCQDIGVTVEPCNTTCLEVVQYCEPVYFNGTEELWPFTCFHYGNNRRQDENGYCLAIQYLVSVSGSILMNETFSEELLDTNSDAYQSLAVQIISESDSLFSSSSLLSKPYLGTKIDGFSAGSVIITFQVFLNQLIDGDTALTATAVHVTMESAIDFQTHFQTLPLLSDTLTTHPAIVMDNVPPRILSCPDNIAMEAGNEEYVFVSWDEPLVSDNSGFWLLKEGPSSSNFFLVDTVTDILYVYVDPSGNQARCEFTVAILPPSCNPMYVELIEGQVVNISTPFYPEDFPREIVCVWNFTAPAGRVVLIEFDVFQLGAAQLITAVGDFSGFQIPAPLISSTFQSSIIFTSTGRQFTYPGFHATVKAVNASYYSDIYCDNGGQVLLQEELFCDGTDHCLDASDEDDCECTEKDFICYDSNSCVRTYQICDGIRDCPLRDDEINCHLNCSAGNVTLMSNQSVSIQSTNFPGFYFPNMECAWIIAAPENHSIIVRTSFLEIGEEDSITIGRGQNVLNTSNIIRILRRNEIRDVAVDDSFAWIRFSSGEEEVTSEGFLLEVVALNQRDFERETFRCYSGHSIIKSEVCNGVNDCPDFADEDGCPPCVDITQTECQSLLPYHQTIFPHPLAVSPDEASSLFSNLGFLAGCHPSVNILLCSVLFPDCPHTGPVKRPCRSFCLNVTDSCKAFYEETMVLSWPVNCENYDDNLPVGTDGFCSGGDDDVFNTEICGTRPAAPIRGRIVGGTEASFGDWPWIASLRDDYGSHQCGATLITERWAITAAHCIGYVSSAVFGDLYLSLPSPYHHETTFTSHRHQQYNPYTKEHDIALLELHKPVNFSDYVRPSCLSTLRNETEVYKRCYIAGWGHLMYEASVVPDRLQEALTHLFTAEECLNYISNNFKEDTMLCAGYDEGGIDTCQGDSGGPLVCEGTDGRWHLVGLTSFGFACAFPRLPGVYTRISQHMDFIQFHVG